ncbi:MAG: tRNA uridine-5-carboxymethylaminomethyl(34) synthesis enzyme MnmG [Alphaproteobacteria bacterium]
MHKQQKHLVIVGGGHAGTEAASVAARILYHFDIKITLITGDTTTIGEMSCNPAIGGLGKGHLVKEIDALGGIMGQAIDKGGIQFRLLNQSRGPAVFGPRAQADRRLYKLAVQTLLKTIPNLAIKNGQVKQIVFDKKNKVVGVKVATGDHTITNLIDCDAVVLTTGTFLRGMIYIGVDKKCSAGRWGEKAENTLSTSLEHLGLSMGRLKTGTPPRLSKKTIDWDSLPKQLGDKIPEPFSCLNDKIFQPQMACAIAHTNQATHDIIKKNLARSAMYGGVLDSQGPRYCPSIEDKVVRFFDKTSHQVFLEPEGYDDDTIYPNGLSTSLPLAVQQQYINSMQGLHSAKILRAGYTIEYDFIDPRQITPQLSVKNAEGLFLAGQINGTTGYEEAAAQGLVAGINAAQYLKQQAAVIFSRTNSYIGVMIDDLTRLGASEPYRMFTARAEHRLFLRPDNADARLTPLGIKLGMIGDIQKEIFFKKMALLKDWREKLQTSPKTPKEWAAHDIVLKQDGKRRSGFDLLAMVHHQQALPVAKKYDGIKLQGDIWQKLIAIYDGLAMVDRRVVRILMAESLYSGYQDRYDQEIKIFQRNQYIPIPEGFDYKKIAGLSAELIEKLSNTRPKNLSAANKIQGMTPAGLYRLQAVLATEKFL